MEDIIRSVSTDQTEILQWILKLYVPEGCFEADSTYSKGGFYKGIPPPRLCFDLTPQVDGVIQADCRNLPLADCSISSLVFDPPFLATTGKSLAEENGNIINRRFTVCKNEHELQTKNSRVRSALPERSHPIFNIWSKKSIMRKYMQTP